MGQFVVTVSGLSLTAATARSAIELATGSSVDNLVYGFDVSFNGATSTATPVLVEIINTTATGTGTGTTPTRHGQNKGRAPITTAKTSLTVEGSTPTVVASWYVPPTSGFSYMWPLGREVGMANSAFLALRLTAPAAVSAAVNVFFEE